MKKKIMYGSIGAAIFLVLASLSSVIVFATSQSESQQQAISSPLFHMRTSQSNGQKDDQSIRTAYLGKGNTPFLFVTKLSSAQSMMERGLQVLKTSPVLIEKSLRRMLQDRQIQQILQQNGITEQQVLQYFNEVKNSPELLADQFAQVKGITPSDNGPKPLQLLNTSNPLACVITAVILLPILLVIGLIIATLTIVTCLNLNNCFNNLMNNFLQELHSP